MSVRRRVVGIVVLAAAAGAAAHRADAQSSGAAPADTFAVSGRVVEESRAPVERVRVVIALDDSVLRVALTDSDGRFVLRRLPAGPHQLVARRLGFHPRSVGLVVPSAGAVPLVVVLEPLPTELERVRVEARIDESHGKLREFYAHKERAQFGYFFGPEQLEAKRLQVASDLMRSVPGVRLIAARFGNAIRIRDCQPLVWLDGQRVVGAELDEVVDPDDIEAVEVYNSLAGVPTQYYSYAGRCGTIVVWTRVR